MSLFLFGQSNGPVDGDRLKQRIPSIPHDLYVLVMSRHVSLTINAIAEQAGCRQELIPDFGRRVRHIPRSLRKPNSGEAGRAIFTIGPPCTPLLRCESLSLPIRPISAGQFPERCRSWRHSARNCDSVNHTQGTVSA